MHGRFAEILLPLPVGGTFTYRVPEDLQEIIKTGTRAVVQFGPRKIYAGLVSRLHDNPPEGGDLKTILSLLDEEPVATPLQLEFWNWISSYYLCHPGEVMNAALPTALKLASESKISINPGFSGDISNLNEKELLLLEALHHRKYIAVSEVARILEQQKTLHIIKTLLEKGVIVSEEEVSDPYRPKLETFVGLSPTYHGNEALLQELFATLEKKAVRQLEILMTWMRLSGYGFGQAAEVKKSLLLKESQGTLAQLKLLVERGVFQLYDRVVSRFEIQQHPVNSGNAELEEFQEKALGEIRKGFEEKEVVLLHGVTSSGKTELYIRLMQETIEQGRQVLFLLPEIALTTQIISRLKKYFGNRVGVFHSRFQASERVDIYRAVLAASHQPGESRYDIIIGARSAVFLPFSRLGLVVVDEEHDPSYKQSDPAPRYNGRDAAIFLARLHGAKTLLGSATPSVESYYNAIYGKYGLVEMSERYAGIRMPKIEIVDIREATRQGQMRSHFSATLIEQLKALLAAGEQAILFQNRRGFSLRLECETCNWMPVCKNCDVTLVYHKQQNQLRCHYCGYVARIPEQCPECKGIRIKMKGFGTEKVEEELGLMLPGSRIARMDLDTTRSKHAMHQIISDFEAGRINILVGTQMVTKGLDFDRVSLVCILNADNMLSYPDFRSAERSFQLMAQVSGRSGRKNKQGHVIIQTRQPYHRVIGQVVDHDYLSMYNYQAAERANFGYPPFTRMIMLKLKHPEQEKLNQAASILAKMLRSHFGNRILGPEYPLISRIMNQYIKHIMIKIRKNDPLRESKEKLLQIINSFYNDLNFKTIRVIIDVDPQ